MKKIILIDDEPEILHVTRLFLEKNCDYEVTVANSASEALEFISGMSFDVIISDYQMPDMNGVELLMKIRGSGNDIPFILLSSYDLPEIILLNNLDSQAASFRFDPKSVNAKYVWKSGKIRQMFDSINFMISGFYAF